ncbi:hypothetical protein [Filomicrobium sp.]|uniref:hypothetical protein n=1 Tax=Filomicrobium sp. TaxID=2024831 RepID=UPI00258C81BA|nr:hypothetical protein [Filomicrobium sp.]MCV0371101.1 hypothetical protein [Filomicrobium sp.]
MTELWYSPADGLPPLGVRVEVLWRGRTFKAARIARKGGRGHVWMTTTEWVAWTDWVDGAPRRKHDRRSSPVPVMLPDDGLPGVPRHGEDALGLDPDAWRPENPAAWKMPLPVPIHGIQAGRMWSARGGFSAVDEAEAAELAREMEAERETARAQGALHGADGETGTRWWLDPTRVTYSPPGQVSIAESEARVSRAILTDGLTGQRNPQGVRTSRALADITADGLGDDDEIADRVARFDPLPQDIEDYLTAMGWFAQLCVTNCSYGYVFGDFTTAQLALVWRARGRSWRSIAGDLCVSDDTTHRNFAEGLVRVHRVANGRPATGTVSVHAERAALADRDKQIRRRAA